MIGTTFSRGVRFEALGVNTSGGTAGTTVTADASADTKGSWTSLGTTNFEYAALQINSMRHSVSAQYLIDVAFGSSGNEVPVAGNLSVSNTLKTGDYGQSFLLPIRIPLGKTVRARIACSTGGASAVLSLSGMSRNVPGFNGFSQCVPIFVSTNSHGTQISGSGSANSKGSWTTLSASLPYNFDAMMIIIDPVDANRGSGNGLLDIGVGAEGSEYVLIPNLSFTWGSSQDTVEPDRLSPFPVKLKSGTRLSARFQADTTTAGDDSLGLAVYGFVL